MRVLRLAILIVASISPTPLPATAKPHVITFGKWTTIDAPSGPGEEQTSRLKVRALYVDGRLREFTLGPPHEITERLFVVQRMIRVNDSLPSDAGAIPQWIWQRGGWMIVDRGSGRVSPASLPQFDPEFSAASWYRDYVAYCGLSTDGKKMYATVVQLGRRKPVLEKQLNPASDDPASAPCTPPSWERRPPRVTFISQDDKKATFAVGARAVQVTNDDEDEGGRE